jgi:hypothetical protein
MSSSSNTNIAKKARTKAEADFATWLMMATTLYPYFQEGRWVLLQVAAESNATPVRGAINIVSLAPSANDGLLGKFASMLVRPDGYLAHVSAVDDAGGIEFAAGLPAPACVQDHDGYTSARVSSRRLDLPSSTTPIK